jgi:gluconolactonase
MKKTLAFAGASLLLIASVNLHAQDKPLFNEGAKPQLVSKQFSFTEGASVDKKGNVFFTDQPNDKIWEYDVDGNLTVFKDHAGRPNGMYFDRKGNLVVCTEENNQLLSIDPKGNVTVLFTDLEGKKLNGPNDVWVDDKGGVYMTDPYYQRAFWTRKQSELDGEKVYYLPKGAKVPVVVISDFKKPNGIVGTPDGKSLYVADIDGRKTWKYKIDKDGSLSDKQLFVEQGSDGMTLDERGDLYICNNGGVTVYNPKGEKITFIAIPEPWTANLCFGGKNKDILFVTASKAIYTLPMNVKGVE